MDLRYPIGLMFSVLGALLTAYGVMNPDLRAPLAPVNVNLYAGLGMLVFGGSMLLLARRSRK